MLLAVVVVLAPVLVLSAVVVVLAPALGAESPDSAGSFLGSAAGAGAGAAAAFSESAAAGAAPAVAASAVVASAVEAVAVEFPEAVAVAFPEAVAVGSSEDAAELVSLPVFVAVAFAVGFVLIMSSSVPIWAMSFTPACCSSTSFFSSFASSSFSFAASTGLWTNFSIASRSTFGSSSSFFETVIVSVEGGSSAII